MLHPLEQQLALLRSRVRRLVTLHGLCWLLAIVLATVAALGSLDYLLRFQQRGPRLACSLAVLGVLLWTGYRYVYLPARRGSATPTWRCVCSGVSPTSTTGS